MERSQVRHTSVLLNEVVNILAPKEGDVYVDATLGGAGHALAFCKASGGKAEIVGIEADKKTANMSRETLSAVPCSSIVLEGNFRNIRNLLESVGIRKVTKILFDLGVSEFSYKTSGRGFSFAKDEPLDMRFDPEAGHLTVGDIVGGWSETDLENVLTAYGDERYAKKIAKAIVEERKSAPIVTTKDLVRVIESCVPASYRKAKIHPATRTFQALRIAVNDEIDALKEGLEGAFDTLSSGGVMAVISFHSLEAREVRNYFNKLKREKRVEVLTKNIVRPSIQEVRENPKSRSANLRAIRKI